ncbi:hypothetical protein [Methanospirillum hungatei]|uniref:hypothetical protein n=1 Tax=Methanospirillum hungatei TaxID=2203 RepID=UPI0026EE7942|nr:hypothetical protein [Methanospirillum hungatei]MCA1915161.1 hypothetical protein [Methanospirillum hungatei]
MVIELLSYDVSPINNLLKIVITIGFALATFILFQCQKRYGGLLHQISILLFISAIAATFSSYFRFQGDFYTSYKWGESIVGLIFVVLSLIIALIIRKKIQAIVHLFEETEGSE